MSNEKDYLDEFEVHRQEVELDEVSKRRTRTRSSRKQNNAPKSPLMKILVVIFIFIPLTLLGYVWFFYEPEIETAAPEIDSSIVHIEKNNTPAASPVVEEDKDEEEIKQNEEQDSSNTSTNEIEVKEEEEQAIEQATQEAEQLLKEQQQKEEEKANEQSSNASSAKTHVVQTNDTLYSIAMKYYKDPTKVEAIKKANNLSSDSIPLGKELILP